MTPLQFEQLYQTGWAELETLVATIEQQKTWRKSSTPRVDGERLAALYRKACEHLALARARAYPAYIQDRLDRITAHAHQVIYQHRASARRASCNSLRRIFHERSVRTRCMCGSPSPHSCCRRSSSAFWCTRGRS
ncbi:MAG: hypothetical protein WDO56_37380 [Gammaproteobacteria bacterium]